MLKCNLNVPVYVKLTEHGLYILAKHYSHVGWKPESSHDNYYKFQLWDLMNIFGSELSMGCKVPFEDNEIKFVK